MTRKIVLIFIGFFLAVLLTQGQESLEPTGPEEIPEIEEVLDLEVPELERLRLRVAILEIEKRQDAIDDLTEEREILIEGINTTINALYSDRGISTEEYGLDLETITFIKLPGNGS